MKVWVSSALLYFSTSISNQKNPAILPINMNLHVYYRLSDKGRLKQKIPGVTLVSCLRNFLHHFQSVDRINIIADNVGEDTYTAVVDITSSYPQTTIHIERTCLGNSGAIKHALRRACQECTKGDYIYFVEDDYIHKQDALTVLMEGLKRFDYVTLYDHLDKYTQVQSGGEMARVCVSETCHWKCTNSTTMTFACSYEKMQDDCECMQRYLHTNIPQDFLLFRHLIRHKRRTLASSLPGFCTHGEWPSPLTDWVEEIKHFEDLKKLKLNM